LDKNDLLLSRFIEHAQLARTEGKASTTDLLLYENDCYVFEDAELLDRNASIINPGGGADYNNATRQRVRFIRFMLKVRPRNIDTNSERVDAEAMPRTVNQSAYIHVITNNNSMTNGITRDIVETDIKELIQQLDGRDKSGNNLRSISTDDGHRIHRKS
jgi:hypothetical protein